MKTGRIVNYVTVVLLICLMQGVAFAGVEFCFNEPNWLASISGPETFPTTAVNLEKSSELDHEPVSEEYVGVKLTFPKENTGLSRSFSVEALEQDGLNGEGFLFDPPDMGAPGHENSLVVGDGRPVPTRHNDDDWEMVVTSGSNLYAFAFDLLENDPFNNEDDDILYVYDTSDNLLATYLEVPEDTGTQFVGIISDVPIGRVLFDEGTDLDNIAIANFRFASRGPLYVDDDASAGGDGLSWSTAFKHLHDALAVAVLSDEIRVAEGTYYPDHNSANPSGTGLRIATFQLVNGVGLYGGYAGIGAADPDERDSNQYVTTLDGNIGSAGSPGDNSYNVVTASGTEPNTILDSFTIKNGYADGAEEEDKLGAGLFNSSGSPTLNNIMFQDNYAALDGGAIYWNLGTSSITDCIFINNKADRNAGAITMWNGDTIVSKCQFIGNSTTGSYGTMVGGGAILIGGAGTPSVINCTFSGNTTTKYGGGIFTAHTNTTTVKHCTFNKNSAASGGGIYHWSSGLAITNCILWENTASSGNQIGGSSPDVTYSDIQGGWTGTGNIDCDPSFVDADGLDDDDLRLTRFSCCIDAGPDAGVYTDLDGNPRPCDYPRVDNGGLFDLGAYEKCEYEPIEIHVDDINGDDGNSGMSREDAFKTIQKGIEDAFDEDTVLVWPGIYGEDVDFLGKGITVRSAADAAEIVAVGVNAVTFHTDEGQGSVLENFVIRDSYTGIFASATSPTIRFVTVVNCDQGIWTESGADPDISNSILWDNANGDLINCTASWSCIQDGDSGEGNIRIDPYFADPANGDYHLKSERGRYQPVDPNHPVEGYWVLDEVTSPCIDGGDPGLDASGEPVPNGDRVNMGAHGQTGYASRSMQAEIWGLWPLVGDINHDGIVDLRDMALLAANWLKEIED